ncbi:MAG: hypothetical protein V1881_01710 [Candidatus Micrarchaeota archaeon]
MGRGRERMVVCEKCGRQTRRDKAVFLEKAIFINPLERKDVIEGEPYAPRVTREVAYCPSCGKHGRIYEKKARLNARNRERAEFRNSLGMGQNRRPTHRPQHTGQQFQTQAPVAAKPPEAAAEEPKKEETAPESGA